MAHHRIPNPPGKPPAADAANETDDKRLAAVLPLFREDMQKAPTPKAREEVFVRYLERALDAQAATNVELHELVTAVRALGGNVTWMTDRINAMALGQGELSKAIADESARRQKDALDQADTSAKILLELSSLRRTGSQHEIVLDHMKAEQRSIKDRLALAGLTPQNAAKGLGLTLLTILGNLLAAWLKGG